MSWREHTILWVRFRMGREGGKRRERAGAVVEAGAGAKLRTKERLGKGNSGNGVQRAGRGLDKTTKRRGRAGQEIQQTTTKERWKIHF